jgi:hypothetical protein
LCYFEYTHKRTTESMTFGAVPPLEWDLRNMRDVNRRHRLLHPPDPVALISSVSRQAQKNSKRIYFCWETAIERFGFQRIIAQIPLDRDTFDPLINGRTSYRAQYYVSVECGDAFNRALVDALVEPIHSALDMMGFPVSWSIARASLSGSWSKIWVAKDDEVFGAAEPDELRPTRWVNEAGELGRMQFRAPLPKVPAIDFKGTWIRPSDGETWLSPDKADRGPTFYKRGHV